MNRAKTLALVMLTLALAIGTASAQQFVIKKRTFVVTVEENSSCSRGIAVSGESLDGRRLCADYPEGVVGFLQNYVGSTVPIEAMWIFQPGPSDQVPVALGGITMVGEEKIEEAKIGAQKSAQEKIREESVGAERAADPCTSHGMAVPSTDPSLSCHLSAALSGKGDSSGSR